MTQDFASALRKLEFDKVLRRIGSLAVSDPGKVVCDAIAPSTDPAWIVAELQRVEEAKQLLITEGSMPLEGLKDILPHLKKTTVEERILTPTELLEVAGCLRAGRMMSGFLRKRTSIAPGLATIAQGLFADKVIEFNIESALTEAGQVRDSASRDLQSIRREMAQLREHLRKRLTAILKEVSQKEMTQDDIITTRDGRLVIPVKSEYKHRVAGFIHSTSASGATVFLEPAEALDLNNGLRELQFREQREIDRILRDLTAQVAGVREELLRSLQTLAVLDGLAARGRYSIEIMGSAPQVAPAGRLVLSAARHPLLLQTHPRDEVVPLSIELGGETRTIMITGPNAGGKSVALKTVGLCVLLAQSGIHVPASPDSRIPVFSGVFVDIGDDQSIEQDLSTFSSHLASLRAILQGASDRSLVLIDEIGAGTDPVEGDALAASLLQHLLNVGALTIATTHHSSLKVFAHRTPGMANASMEFDQQHLRPTYRFCFGIPGSSYALELAQRMELDPRILREARAMLGDQTTTLESLIASLQQQLSIAREAAAEARAKESRLTQLVDSYEQKLADVRNEIRDLRQAAREEVRKMVAEGQATIERTVRSIRESSAQKDIAKQARDALRSITRELDETPDTEPVPVSLHVGQSVRLKGTSPEGEITAINGSLATVLWENGTMKVRLHELEPAPQRDAGRTDATFALPEVTSELDLRGLTGDEAANKVQHFLDDAYVAGLHRVDIIHGKGTGALRRRIADLLKGYPHVKSFRLGQWNEGGSGVTVVELGGEQA